MTIANSKGTIWYGLHMYPGVAEYLDKKTKKPFRVCINEPAIRKMDKTFEGKPVFVRHADGDVTKDRKKLRTEADGWVIESFFNPADGNHWAKIVTVTDEADQAIKNKWGFSNAYDPTQTAGGGTWNSVPYKFEVLDGVYEHLAIVPNPRYEQSKILTPEEFKEYNARQVNEVKRIANSSHNTKKKEPRVKTPKFKMWNKQKIENAEALEKTIVLLPKSKKEMTIAKLVNEHDELLSKQDDDVDVLEQEVEVAGESMTVGELVEKHETLVNEIENADDSDDDEDDDVENEDDEDDDDMENEDDDEEVDEEPKPTKKENKSKKKNSEKPTSKKKNTDTKKNAGKGKKENSRDSDPETKKKNKDKADRLRNARDAANAPEGIESTLLEDGIARGKSRYGSGT